MEFSVIGNTRYKKQWNILCSKDESGQIQILSDREIDAHFRCDGVDIIKIPRSSSRMRAKFVLGHLLTDRTQFFYRNQRWRVHRDGMIRKFNVLFRCTVLALTDLNAESSLMPWSYFIRLPRSPSWLPRQATEKRAGDDFESDLVTSPMGSKDSRIFMRPLFKSQIDYAVILNLESLSQYVENPIPSLCFVSKIATQRNIYVQGASRPDAIYQVQCIPTLQDKTRCEKVVRKQGKDSEFTDFYRIHMNIIPSQSARSAPRPGAQCFGPLAF